MILLVEDDLSHVELVRRAFSERLPDHEIVAVGSVVEAKTHMTNSAIELVMADLVLPDGTCLELLPGDLNSADYPIIVMTSHGSEKIAVDAMKAGALDYIVKSEAALQELPHLATRAMREWNHLVERRRLETEIVEAQRLASIGTLAGGIAHDFNNLLMGIQGEVSLLELDTGKTGGIFERTQSIKDLVRSGAELTRQLLGFARAGRYEVTAVDINSLIMESSELFGRTRRATRIHRRLEGDALWVSGDKGQLHQVLLNLYLNAWQAMPDGGELFLETETLGLQGIHDETHFTSDGPHVTVRVRDTGSGMDSEVQSHMFEPFFSTKPNGTGLGLASVQGIVAHHNGRVEVQSTPEVGTTVELRFPITDPPYRPDREAGTTVESGSGTILLVDDESVVLKVSAALLSRLGYVVFQASSGEEALALFRKDHAEIDLVVLDMIMPDLPGAAVAPILREIDSSVPILLCSGYALDGEAESLLETGCVGFLQKPFDLETLSQRIASSLRTRKL